MKYTCEIVIDSPIDDVIALFDNPDNMKEWQPGFISHEHMSGEPGQPGSKMRLKYKMGNRDIEMVETILTRNLPEEFSGTYEAKGVYNIVKNSFEATGDNKTRWVTYQEFKFSGFMKLIGWLMPGSFKKRR
jgi:carbon monoxide dehydrogenase subunit G